MNYADNRGVNGEQTRILTRTKKKQRKSQLDSEKWKKGGDRDVKRKKKKEKNVGAVQNEQQSGSEEENFMLIISNYRKKKRGKSWEFWVLESHFMFVWLAMDNTHVSLSLLCENSPHRRPHQNRPTPRVSICLDAPVASERSTREKKVREYHNWHHHAIMSYSCAPPGRSSNKRIKLLKSFSFLARSIPSRSLSCLITFSPTRPLQNSSKLMIISRAVMRNGRRFFMSLSYPTCDRISRWLTISRS